MATCQGTLISSRRVFITFKHLKGKYLSYMMSPSRSFLFILMIFLSGVAVTCFVTFLPTLLLSFYQNKPAKTVSLHDTSVVFRSRQQLVPPNPDVLKEAMSALRLALDMEAQGKHEKAIRLFEQALKIDPSHADILTAYGEFLEKHKVDVLKADHMYRRALQVCPDHSQALINRQRILPVVEEIDQTNFNRIDKKLESFVRVPQHHPGLRRAKKEAYFSHIYHTNAIEGNTLTLMQTRAIVETRIAVGGKSLVEQNEVLGLDSALSYLNNTLLGRVGDLKLADILEIHKRVLGYVDPTEAGRFRLTQVFVGEFQPPGPLDVPDLMDEFVDWLNSEDALKLHPIEFAALAHYKLVVIHPFYDGNGRTSRLLMNLILMQAGFPPVSVKIEDRLNYYESLEMANNGDVHNFIRFIAGCTERTLDEFLLATTENHGALMAKNTTRNVIMSKYDDEL